jgi:hypothetical protein
VEQRSVIRGVLLAAVVVVIGSGAAVVRARPAVLPAPVQAPAGARVRVQVLNATTTRGLARRATGYLRDRGFDVVDIATAHEQRDSTLVIDRSGHPEWAWLIAKAFGGAHIESRPDSSSYLDVTVLVGRDWTPPPEPFYP